MLARYLKAQFLVLLCGGATGPVLIALYFALPSLFGSEVSSYDTSMSSTVSALAVTTHAVDHANCSAGSVTHGFRTREEEPRWPATPGLAAGASHARLGCAPPTVLTTRQRVAPSENLP